MAAASASWPATTPGGNAPPAMRAAGACTREWATRDWVSRSSYAEMRAGRTSPMGGVYLQMSHLGPEKVAKTFPGMVSRCLDCGFDLAGGRVEVVPTAHYLMGGVEFDVDCSTAAPGLFAAGE